MTALLSKPPVDATWPRRKRTAKEHMEKRDVDSRIQVAM